MGASLTTTLTRGGRRVWWVWRTKKYSITRFFLFDFCFDFLEIEHAFFRGFRGFAGVESGGGRKGALKSPKRGVGECACKHQIAPDDLVTNSGWVWMVFDDSKIVI